MSDEPSPRPWRVKKSIRDIRNCIEDANGNDVGTCWLDNDRRRAEANAAIGEDRK